MSEQKTIAAEQAAFEAQLPELLPEHSGQFVLFKNGKVVGFFDTDAAAYEEGLNRFGIGETFLITRVAPPRVEPASISWEFGLVCAE